MVVVLSGIGSLAIGCHFNVNAHSIALKGIVDFNGGSSYVF